MWFSTLQKNDIESSDSSNEGSKGKIERGVFAVTSMHKQYPVTKVLLRSQIKHRNINSLWGFIQKNPVLVFWDDDMNFEFYVLHSNGRLCRVESPHPFSRLHRANDLIKQYYTVVSDPFNARIYLHNEVDNKCETDGGSMVVFTFDMLS